MSQQQQRYRVIERIAAGGMAEVYRAESAGLEGFKKVVAIKRVLPHLSEKKKFIGMFLDEARVSAQLSHSNCVQVFDIGVGDNTYFIVMEFVDGADLKAIIERKRKQGQPFPTEEACLICTRICEGLDYAHRLTGGEGRPLGIVHRDMSPPNVLLTRFGEVKIVDFGLAKANVQLEHSEPGIIKGKFSYLSPEAARGQDIDHRTDIFAVGIILWEMLAGRRLFLGETDLETVKQVQAAAIPPIRQYNPNVSEDLETVIASALAGDPDERYQSAQHLAQDLTTVLFRSPRPVSSFDVAALVQDVIDAQERDPTSKKIEKGSIIGALIDEALFEFTSLEGDGGSDPSSPTQSGDEAGATPLNLGSFGGPADWGAELDLGGGHSESHAALPSDAPIAGNLASLEDDSPSGRHRSRRPPAASAPGLPSELAAAAPAPAPPPPASAPASEEPAGVPKKGGSGGLIVLILLLILVGGAAGAYYGGLIPPDLIPK